MELLSPGQMQPLQAEYVSVAPDGTIFCRQYLRDAEGGMNYQF